MELCHFNPVALRMAKTLWSFGLSECNRVNGSVIIFEKGEGAFIRAEVVIRIKMCFAPLKIQTESVH